MRIEIAHDALAKKIYQKASTDDKMLLRVTRLVQERFGSFDETNTYLSREELNFIDPYKRELKHVLEPDEKRYISRSRTFRRREVIVVVVLVAMTIIGLVVGMFYFNTLKDLAQAAKNNLARKSKANELVALAIQKESVSPELALKLVLAAKSEVKGDQSIDQVSRLIFRRNNFSYKELIHRGIVYDVAFSPNGKHLATACMDRLVRIWDIDGNLLKVLEGHRRMVNSVAFSPDGRYLVSSSDDETAIVWNVDSEEIVHTLRGHQKDVNDAKFSPNGLNIVTVSRDKTAKLWSAEDGALIRTFIGHDASVYAVDFSPGTGEYIATASRDSFAIVWNVSRGRELSRMKHNDFVYGVAFSPKQKSQLATACRDDVVRLWNANAPSNPTLELRGHTGAAINVAFSPTGDTLLSSSWDNTARLWELSTEKSVRVFHGHEDIVLGIDYGKHGKYIATSGKDNEVRLWNLKLKRNLKNITYHEERVQAVAFSQYGKYILTGSWDDKVVLWNAQTWDKLLIINDINSDIEAVAFHPSEEAFAVAAGAMIYLYDINGQLMYTFEGHSETVKSIRFSSTGNHLVSGGRDDLAILWTIQGEIEAVFRGHKGDILSVDFCSTNDTIVTASWDQSVIVWDTSGQIITQLRENNMGRQYAVAYSPKGSQLLSGGTDGTIRLWNVNTKKVQNKYRTNSYIYDLAFVPNTGNRFVTAGNDNTGRLWDTSGRVLQIYEQTGDVFAIDVHPDNHYIMLGGIPSSGVSVFYTLEGFLQNNHFTSITIYDKLKFELIKVNELTKKDYGNNLEQLRKLAYYLEDQGVIREDVNYLNKAYEVYEIILKKTDQPDYDQVQAYRLQSRLALFKVKQNPNDPNARKIIDNVMKIGSDDGELLLNIAHAKLIRGEAFEADDLYAQLKGKTYGRNIPLTTKAIAELNDFKEKGLLKEKQVQAMKSVMTD